MDATCLARTVPSCVDCRSRIRGLVVDLVCGGRWGNHQRMVGAEANANKLHVFKMFLRPAIHRDVGFVNRDEAGIFAKINPLDFHNPKISNLSRNFKILRIIQTIGLKRQMANSIQPLPLPPKKTSHLHQPGGRNGHSRV